jgi:hypothetical protein
MQHVDHRACSSPRTAGVLALIITALALAMWMVAPTVAFAIFAARLVFAHYERLAELQRRSQDRDVAQRLVRHGKRIDAVNTKSPARPFGSV